MREITLRPGESITIGDTVVKAEFHAQQIATPFPVPEAPAVTRHGHGWWLPDDHRERELTVAGSGGFDGHEHAEVSHV